LTREAEEEVGENVELKSLVGLDEPFLLIRRLADDPNDVVAAVVEEEEEQADEGVGQVA
jgi:hypothetical protein